VSAMPLFLSSTPYIARSAIFFALVSTFSFRSFFFLGRVFIES
jgi:hypothetical protein